MGSLSDILNKINGAYKANKFDIAIISIIILIVLLAVGIWRLEKARPQKEPIEVTHNISFMSLKAIS